MLIAALTAAVVGGAAGCLGDFEVASDAGMHASVDAAGPHPDLAPVLSDVFMRTGDAIPAVVTVAAGLFW